MNETEMAREMAKPNQEACLSGLPAPSGMLTTRAEAIFMSFGFDRIDPPLRHEKLEGSG